VVLFQNSVLMMQASHICKFPCQYKLLHSFSSWLSRTHIATACFNIRRHCYLHDNSTKNLLLPRCVNIVNKAYKRKDDWLENLPAHYRPENIANQRRKNEHLHQEERDALAALEPQHVPYINTWKKYKPIRKGQTVNYRLRHRKKTGMWMLYTGFGYDYTYSPEELNKIINYDDFVNDLKESIIELKSEFARVVDTMDRTSQIKDKKNEEKQISDKKSPSLANVLDVLDAKTGDGKFVVFELVQVTQPEDQILRMKMDSSLYIEDLMRILEESGLHLQMNLDERDSKILYVCLAVDDEPVKDPNVEKVHMISEIILKQIQDQKSYCLGQTRKTDTSNHLFMQVTAQINKELDKTIEEVQSLTYREKQRWTLLE